jgi:uncharacterized damage-inducible protein DinB
MSKAILSFLLYTLLCSASFGQDLFKENLLEKWGNQKSYLLECVDSLEDVHMDYKANENSMSIRDLLLHMGQNMLWLSETYLDGGEYIPLYTHKDLSKREMMNHLESLFTYTHNAIEGVDPSQYKNGVDFFAGEKNVMQIMELIDDHLTHHKGQLTVNMALLDVAVPKYKGW